jgi:hypothetical protein
MSGRVSGWVIVVVGECGRIWVRALPQKWHFLKDHVEQGTIKLRYLPNDQIVADMFAKPLLRPALTRHRNAILGGEDPLQRFTP